MCELDSLRSWCPAGLRPARYSARCARAVLGAFGVPFSAPLRGACAVLLGISLGSGALAAQRGDTLIAARVARLEAAWRAATAAAAADSARRVAERGLTDTVHAGGLVVLVPGEALTMVRDAAAGAWGAIDSTFGSAAAALGPQHFFVAAAAPDRLRIGPRWEVGAWEGAPRDAHVVEGDARMRLREHLESVVAARLTGTLDAPIAGWLEGAIPTARASRESMEATYVEIVTHPTRPGRACAAGDTAGCELALALQPAEPLRDFYDAVRRRALVRGLESIVTHDERRRSDFDACVDRGSDAACLAFLTSADPALVPRHLFAPARRALVRLALTTGGPDAFARLRASAGRPLPERLALAANRPLDLLVADWRRATFAARPAVAMLEPRVAWAALGWVVALALLAMRSTRWR